MLEKYHSDTCICLNVYRDIWNDSHGKLKITFFTRLWDNYYRIFSFILSTYVLLELF